MRIILYVFAGRQANMELLIPLLQRIIAENPDVEVHLWNLARLRQDGWFLQYLPRTERLMVRNDFARIRPKWASYNKVWNHYSQPEYKDSLLVKCDDDVVFLQTERFGEFVDTVAANPGAIVSADVVNNGACARHQPGIWQQFQASGIPLLDWHLHAATARMAHEYFLEHHRDVLAQPVEVIPTDDWCSINLIGYDWATGCAISETVGLPPDPARGPKLHATPCRVEGYVFDGKSTYEIAGRTFNGSDRIGDEGAANMFPRLIVKGFTAAHLGFGPQDPSVEQLVTWRDRYRAIGETYLEEEDRAELRDRAPVQVSG